MNVDHYLPNIQTAELNRDTIARLVAMRYETFCGFATIEATKGFVKPAVSFSTSQGQEMLRIMLFRVMEEIIESHNAISVNHIQEELIDALNYMLSAIMLDVNLFSQETVTDMFYKACYDFILEYPYKSKNWTCHSPNASEVYHLTKAICGDLAESFRNRAWMNQTQQTYFHGFPIVVEVFRKFMMIILKSFENWDNFYRMYVAKDMVLQFRLQSKY